MNNIRTFEEELCSLKQKHDFGYFEYASQSIPFKSVVTSHFRNINKDDKHGIYIVRQKSSGKVLYIGKGGTISQDGTFEETRYSTQVKECKRQ